MDVVWHDAVSQQVVTDPVEMTDFPGYDIGWLFIFQSTRALSAPVKPGVIVAEVLLLFSVEFVL